MNRLGKILKCSLLLSLLVVISPLVAHATSSNSLVGPDLASPGDTITYDIKVNSDVTINKYNVVALTYETSVLDFVGIENKNDWKGNNTMGKGEGSVNLNFTHENGTTGETIVATLRFKVKKDAAKSSTDIGLSGSIGTSEEETTVFDKVTKTIAIRSTDNTLKDLKLNGKTVVNFSPSTYSYSLQVEATTVTASIDATLNSNTATFKEKYGPRSIPLDYGQNVIEIKVLSDSQEEKTYVINITRLDNRGTNNDLKTLILNAGKVKLNFNKNVLEYNIKTHKLAALEVEATPEDSKATVQVYKPEKITIGQNVVTIVVTSEDKTEKTYKITINNVDYDIDTSLKNIELFGIDEELEFDPKVFDYEIRYKAKYKDSLVVKPVLNKEEDDVQIDEPLLEKTMANLESGSVIQIRVYATDGTESMYTITLVKDTRINFFLLLGIFLLIVLLVVFITLWKRNKRSTPKEPTNKEKKTSDLEKTKRLQKINLE